MCAGVKTLILELKFVPEQPGVRPVNPFPVYLLCTLEEMASAGWAESSWKGLDLTIILFFGVAFH